MNLQEEITHLTNVRNELMLHSKRLGEHIRKQMEMLLQVVHSSTEVYQAHVTYLTALDKLECARDKNKNEDPSTPNV